MWHYGLHGFSLSPEHVASAIHAAIDIQAMKINNARIFLVITE
jgi:hypothetical protein